MSGLATLAYGLLAPGAAKASSYQARYVPDNVLLGKVQRPWRSLSLGSDWLQIDFGESVNIGLLAINGANMGFAEVYADDSSTPVLYRGAITSGTDKQGRVKGSRKFGDASTVTNAAVTTVFSTFYVGVADASRFNVAEWVLITDGTNSIKGVITAINGTTQLVVDTTSAGGATTGTPTSIGVHSPVTIVPARYVRFTNFDTHLDANAFWSIASVFAFSNWLNLPRDPLYGETSIDVNTPQSRQDLDNGHTVKDDTGPSWMSQTLQFSGKPTDDHEQIMRLARSGLCWLNLNDGNAGDQWPVRHFEPKTTRKFSGFNRETVQIPLKEEV